MVGGGLHDAGHSHPSWCRFQSAWEIPGGWRDSIDAPLVACASPGFDPAFLASAATSHRIGAATLLLAKSDTIAQ